MSTIFENYNGVISHWTRHEGTYGVEFETETADPYDPPRLKLWNSTGDTSILTTTSRYH